MTTTLNSKEASIAFYIEQGFTLFPLIGKVPPKGFHWRQATFDPFADFVGNFGVQLQADDLVIDVDPRNGGLEFFERLIKITSIPPTLSVQTGSGGTHYYLKKAPDFKIRKNLKEFKGIDFISEGGYVVGAGSIHPDTNQEYVLNGSFIYETPKELLELIEKKQVELTSKGVTHYVDDEQTKQRFISYLKKAPIAIEGESGDATTFTICAMGRDFGLPADITFELISLHYNYKCEPPWEPQQLKIKVENAYKYAHGEIGSQSPTVAFQKQKFEEWSPEQDKYFHRTEGGKIKLDQHNTALMFNKTFPLEGLIAMDLFSHNIIFKKQAPWHSHHDRNKKFWDDDEAQRCRHWLSVNFKYEPSQNLMHEGALAAAYQYQFHPVKEYWESLKWDGHKRVHNWMHNLLGAEDNEYTRAVGLKTLVACVKRVYEPGCKFDYITVLEGNQRTGKSSTWEILAGKKWFGDSAIDISKEWSIMKTFGTIMYEWSEMETFRKSNTQAMKGFLSSSSDKVRLPYHRVATSIDRQGIFVGTFNPEKDRDIGWLHDTTGNTRYWIIETGVEGDIRLDKLREVRDQLWAEAKVLYESGVPIYFEDNAVIQLAEIEQAKRLGKDSWHDAIEIWLDAPHNIGSNVFSGEDIFKNCIGGNLERYKQPEMRRISGIMRMLGWTKGSFYIPELKKPLAGYRRPSIE